VEPGSFCADVEGLDGLVERRGGSGVAGELGGSVDARPRGGRCRARCRCRCCCCCCCCCCACRRLSRRSSRCPFCCCCSCTSSGSVGGIDRGSIRALGLRSATASDKTLDDLPRRGEVLARRSSAVDDAVASTSRSSGSCGPFVVVVVEGAELDRRELAVAEPVVSGGIEIFCRGWLVGKVRTKSSIQSCASLENPLETLLQIFFFSPCLSAALRRHRDRSLELLKIAKESLKAEEVKLSIRSRDKIVWRFDVRRRKNDQLTLRAVPRQHEQRRKRPCRSRSRASKTCPSLRPSRKKGRRGKKRRERKRKVTEIDRVFFFASPFFHSSFRFH